VQSRRLSVETSARLSSRDPQTVSVGTFCLRGARQTHARSKADLMFKASRERRPWFPVPVGVPNHAPKGSNDRMCVQSRSIMRFRLYAARLHRSRKARPSLEHLKRQTRPARRTPRYRNIAIDGDAGMPFMRTTLRSIPIAIGNCRVQIELRDNDLERIWRRVRPVDQAHKALGR